MEPLALSLLLALAIVALIRRPGAFAPALAGTEVAAHWPGTPASGDDDQMPETDRAPRGWLPWGVGAVAMVRVALLVAMHA
jgi:hypothetical protein